MKRLTLFVTSLAVALTLGGTAALAQRGGGHGGGMGGGAAMGGGGNMGGGAGMGRVSGDTGRENGRMDSMGHTMNTPSMNAKNPDQILSQNTKLSSGLQSLLPAGTDIQQAPAGFKNLGQFVAAVHVSHNLGIPFTDLKEKMLGGDSLGKAIRALKPDADAKAEAKKANREAKGDLKGSEF